VEQALAVPVEVNAPVQPADDNARKAEFWQVASAVWVVLWRHLGRAMPSLQEVKAQSNRLVIKLDNGQIFDVIISERDG